MYTAPEEMILARMTHLHQQHLVSMYNDTIRCRSQNQTGFRNPFYASIKGDTFDIRHDAFIYIQCLINRFKPDLR